LAEVVGAAGQVEAGWSGVITPVLDAGMVMSLHSIETKSNVSVVFAGAQFPLVVPTNELWYVRWVWVSLVSGVSTIRSVRIQLESSLELSQEAVGVTNLASRCDLWLPGGQNSAIGFYVDSWTSNSLWQVRALVDKYKTGPLVDPTS
jgi:hypothetical protein